MNPKDAERALDEVSRESIRLDLDLLPGIMTAIEKKQHAKRSSRKLIFAGLLLAVVFIISLFTLPGAVRAVRSLFGYIPGVGRVEQGTLLRVLAAPVGDSRDGYTLTVESAVLDSTRTVITYRSTGTFPRWEDPTQRPDMCLDLPQLLLPDGTTLAFPTGEGSSNASESTWKLVYGALPADVLRARLVLSCLPDLPAGEGPQDWAFDLVFIPAPPDLTVFPVLDQPTSTPAPASASTPGKPLESTTIGKAGIRWELKGMAVLADGYYLDTLLSWPDMPGSFEVQLFPDALHLTDGAGQETAVWQAGDISSFTPAENLSMSLSLQTSVLNSPGPARLTLDYLGISRFASASFSFDVGSDPQPGQVWPIQQDLELDGEHLRVLSAKYVETPPGAPVMLLIELESDSGIIAVNASDLEHETLDSGGAPASDQRPMQAGWHYRGDFPRGTITVTISMITEQVKGPWTLEWTPPADTITPAAVVPTAMPTLLPGLALCQDNTLLETTEKPLPEGLSGRVAYSHWNGERHELFVSGLDGSNVIALGPGAFPNLSPDGQRVVYRGMDEGTYVRDLETGVAQMLPGSQHPGLYDNFPMWSPDGSQIAFYRVNEDHVFDLYVMSADGSNLRAVTSGPEFEVLIGWNSSGSGLYYRLVGAAGQSVRLLDLASAKSREITRLPEGTYTAIFSPDESRLLYLTGQALWLDPLDGSPAEALLATTGHFANQILPLWSPDGRWVSISYWESPDSNDPIPALLEVDGCRMVRLAWNPGSYLTDWVK